jgi:hypothetical protein
VGELVKTFILSAFTAVAFTATAAQASPISISVFSPADYNALFASGYTELARQDFEQYAEGNVSNGFSTNVGTFSTVGGTGSGGTVTDSVAKGNFAGNDGTKLAVRNGTVYGRSSTTDIIAGLSDNANDGVGDMFLDSNDTLGIIWNVTLGGSMFNRLFFVLTDPTDVGARLTVSAAGATEVLAPFQYRNSTRLLVLVDFASEVNGAEVRLTNSRGNDGISIDDLSVGVVPLPAPAFLLLAGLGGLAALRRKRAAA